MIRILSASVIVAAFVAQGPACAQDTAAARLAKQLYSNDIAENAVPQGYRFEFIDPVARGAFEDVSKVEGRVAARFSRPALAESNPDLKGSWEGFTYYAFGTQQAAARFTLPVPESAYVFQSWLHDDAARSRFDTSKDPAAFPVPVRSVQGVTTALQCLEWDIFIGCLFSEPTLAVAIHLTLLEPKLRAAGDAAERRRIAEARVQMDGAALLGVARQHLTSTARTP